MAAHIGHIDRGGGPVLDVRHIRDRAREPDLDIGQVGLQNGVDGIVTREVDQRIRATQVEGVEQVRSVVLASAQRLFVSSLSADSGHKADRDSADTPVY